MSITYNRQPLPLASLPNPKNLFTDTSLALQLSLEPPLIARSRVYEDHVSIMDYASPPPYFGLADAPSIPLRSYFNAAPSPRHFGHSRVATHDVSENSSPGFSYPSPRYASNGRYATNTRITPPFGVYASDVAQPRSSNYTSCKESFMSSESFSYASPPQNHNPPSTYRAASSGVVPHDEFIGTTPCLTQSSTDLQFILRHGGVIMQRWLRFSQASSSSSPSPVSSP